MLEARRRLPGLFAIFQTQAAAVEEPSGQEAYPRWRMQVA